MNVSTHKIKEGPLKARVQRRTAHARDTGAKEFAHATTSVEKKVPGALRDPSEDATGTAKTYGDEGVGKV